LPTKSDNKIMPPSDDAERAVLYPVSVERKDQAKPTTLSASELYK